MPRNSEAISVLGPLFKSPDGPSPLILLGAGASFRSGVPTAAEAVKRIARLVYSERVLNGQRLQDSVKPSEWEPWLQSFPWFVHGEDRLAENFPLVIEQLLTPAEYRKRVLLNFMRPCNGLSSGYRDLSHLVMRGLVNTILTTNFDTCIVDALREQQPHIRTISEVNRFPGDYNEFSVLSRCQVVWLHGRAEQYSDKNAQREVSAADSELVARLRPLLDSAPIIVIGYRGSEPSVMEGLFAQRKSGRLDFPHGVYWCLLRGESPHPHVQSLARRLGSNFRFLSIDGFDEILADFQTELAGEDRYTKVAARGAPVVAATFDETVVDGATIDDLDLDLALSILRQYCEKLKRAAVTRNTLIALMREQGLLIQEMGADRVTAGAILLFGNAPQAFFPHAVVSITENGKKRQVVGGNLIRQYRQLLENLESCDINPILKVKKRRQHDERRAYPPRVLVELLVNMLVHRDYAIEEPGRIQISTDSEIAFVNPGGLTQKIVNRVQIGNDGQFVLEESLTDQRNPSLCDIFFGISAMERAGTGLMDVNELMTGWGGCAAFYHHASESRFEALALRPQASAGSRTVARSDVPIGLYVFNVLPFNVLPDTVSIVPLAVPLHKRPANMDLSECGTFIHYDGCLWSFVPLRVLCTQLDGIIYADACESVSRTEIEQSPERRRILSWLLRKHWEKYLDGFEEAGLILEPGRKHRAYFASRNKGNRTVVWDGPQRRGNRRDVVKKRKDGPRAWFENEGFGYDIVEFGGLWCIRIKPFYMFTGCDGRTPLPTFVRAGKATSRMKFDRNKNVDADLTFWSTFLGRGHETINIGNLHVDDLLLDASFLTEEIPEIGLIDDDSENQDRVSA